MFISTEYTGGEIKQTNVQRVDLGAQLQPPAVVSASEIELAREPKKLLSSKDYRRQQNGQGLSALTHVPQLRLHRRIYSIYSVFILIM